MKPVRGPARTRWATLVVAMGLAGCASNQLHSEGMRLMAEGQRDAAIARLREASRQDPTNPGYRVDLLLQTQAYGRELLEKADDARRGGNASLAYELYSKALRLDPSNERARRGLTDLELDARSTRLLGESTRLLQEGNLAAAQERAEAALADNPASAAAQQQLALVREQVDKAKQARAAAAAAQSIMNKPVTLQFRDANLRMVFEALSRTTGLNVILDRDVRADLKTTIFVKDAAVEDTVDLILLQNQLEKRSLNANTLFIYPATAAKQKEYQDLQVRTFQVSNIDVKYMQSVLKSVLKVKDMSVDERSGTLVMRDTADAIAVAAKVIAAHDTPEPEVMLEVEVLEISHDRLQNLGIKFPDLLTIGTPSGVDTLSELKHLRGGALTASGLSAALNFKLEDSEANLLASPRIRARNKEKARILIGDRVPIITNSVTPVQSGSVVTGSVQYQDVGLKLEFEPQVYSDQEVGIRINLEVSNIVREIPGPNGSLAYQIGTRNAQTVLRLRDGETQILGGLISAEDRNTSTRLPGLGHLPMVGKLFGNNSSTIAKTEIVLSITPRILRAPARLDAAVRTVFSGTESSTRERPLQLDPIGAVRGQSSGGVPAPVLPAPPGPLPRPPAPGAGATGATGVTGTTASAAPATATGAPPSMRSMLPLMNGARAAAGSPTALPPAAAASEPVRAPVSPAEPAAAPAAAAEEPKVSQATP